MQRLLSSFFRLPVNSIRSLPQSPFVYPSTYRAHHDSSNYADEMYKQWSKDPKSVHQVHILKLKI